MTDKISDMVKTSGKNSSFRRAYSLLCAFAALAVLTGIAVFTSASALPDTIDRTLSGSEQAEIISRNSDLIDYIWLSPNADFPRTEGIRKITIHHMAADLSLDDLGYTFGTRERAASSNYAIDSSGNIALYVEEANRAWTSSSPENDQMAITIEVANDQVGGQWHVSDAAFNSLIDLCVDICERNDIHELAWTGDETGSLTIHSMFNQDTDCPGPYLISRMPEIALLVNERLAAGGI